MKGPTQQRRHEEEGMGSESGDVLEGLARALDISPSPCLYPFPYPCPYPSCRPYLFPCPDLDPNLGLCLCPDRARCPNAEGTGIARRRTHLVCLLGRDHCLRSGLQVLCPDQMDLLGGQWHTRGLQRTLPKGRGRSKNAPLRVRRGCYQGHPTQPGPLQVYHW